MNAQQALNEGKKTHVKIEMHVIYTKARDLKFLMVVHIIDEIIQFIP
jgi:hypothetical protein